MKVEFYKLLSFISVLFFATSMVLSTFAIKSEMPWINQRINEFKFIEKFNLNIIHKYDLKIEYTLTHMIGYALDKNENEKSYYLGKCSYVDNVNNNETCAGPYNEKTPKIVSTIYYINLSFITFLLIMFIVELNYLLFAFVTRKSEIGTMKVTQSFSNFNEIISIENDTVTIKVKFGKFVMIFRFLYTFGTILMYISAYLFVFQFPKLIQKESNENPSTLFVENGITLTFINCILTTLGSILIIVAFYLFNYKLKEIKKKKKFNNQINFFKNNNNKFIIGNNNNNNNNNKYSLLDDENL
ncbi:hypothetical protein ACTFIU_011364 [Dictyostelium citrinum]